MWRVEAVNAWVDARMLFAALGGVPEREAVSAPIEAVANLASLRPGYRVRIASSPGIGALEEVPEGSRVALEEAWVTLVQKDWPWFKGELETAIAGLAEGTVVSLHYRHILESAGVREAR